MNDQLFRTLQCLTMLGLDPSGCLAELEVNTVTTRVALEAMLAHPPSGALTLGLAMACCGAGLAQGRPELSGVLAGIPGQSAAFRLTGYSFTTEIRYSSTQGYPCKDIMLLIGTWAQR